MYVPKVGDPGQQITSLYHRLRRINRAARDARARKPRAKKRAADPNPAKVVSLRHVPATVRDRVDALWAQAASGLMPHDEARRRILRVIAMAPSK